MLHEKNADVLALLSSASPGLLISKSHFEIAIAYLDKVLKGSSTDIVLKDVLSGDDLKAQFTSLRSQLKDLYRASDNPSSTVLDIDENKSFLLAHTFPKQYPEALALLTGKAITIELWSHSESPYTLVEKYMSGQNCDTTVFVRLKETAEKEEIPQIPTDPLIYVNQLLKPLRYSFIRNELQHIEGTSTEESDKFNIAIKHALLPSFGYVHVDPYTWFCSCFTFYEMCQESEVCRQQGKEIVGEVDNLKLSKFNILSFLANSPNFHADRLPMCKHLLAVLLGAANWEVAISEKLITIEEIQNTKN